MHYLCRQMEKTIRCIELLAPARDLEGAQAAIDHGADAVYIGASSFGARQAATNASDDIARAAEYAHRFGARLYVTLNTVLYDSELEEAARLAREMVACGADALIVQDMAYLRMGLSGVELHASTQACNLTGEHVRFLSQCGFARVILERALTLEQIRAIRTRTDTELECFVHGAICVGYSGRCYLSRSMSSRSGNRGGCSQPCRLTWDLEDAAGRRLIRGKHLLSLQDMDFTERIEALLAAGVDSFKIEGRLKDTAYVRNVVSHYRQVLDRALAGRSDCRRSSSGRSEIGFTPDPSRTFTRGGTLYYLDGVRAGVASFDTPKAVGSPVGRVERLDGNGFVLGQGLLPLAPGDGICFFDRGVLKGTNINRVTDRYVVPNRMEGLRPGIPLFRNFDARFAAAIEHGKARRTVEANVAVAAAPDGLLACFTDEDGHRVQVEKRGNFERATDAEAVLRTFRTQLAKSGGTIFRVAEVTVAPAGSGPLPFVPVSVLNELRREGLERLLALRLSRRPEPRAVCEDRQAVYPVESLGGEANVTNALAEAFYRSHGVKHIEPGYDLLPSLTGVRVMTASYCLRRETGRCLREHPADAGPWFLVRGVRRYRLEFDCAACRMSLVCEK